MPKKTAAPPDIFISCHGHSPTDLCDYLTGKRKFPKSSLVKFIGTTFGLAAGKASTVCDDVPRICAALEEREPLLLRAPDIYLFGKQAWLISKAEQSYDGDQLRLVFLETVDIEREKWERLKRKFSGIAGDAIEFSREPIPQRVRMFVWRRDGGKRVQCGSNQKLEYDHMVPVSKGGSNTERNIQLLCEKCNRAKSAKI